MNEENLSLTAKNTATLGGGCFWCLEAVFAELRGVLEVLPGYAGGGIPLPSYEQVCTGMTGHAEVVQVRFAPAVLSYRQLLEIFFSIHDPTTLNRQGADRGTQYRSVIFYHNEEQRQTAAALIEELNAAGIWPDEIVTELAPSPEFWPAEDYHRDYFRKHPEHGYCSTVINPKASKFRKKYSGLLRER